MPDARHASIPAPPSERGAWLLACSLGALGLAVLIAVLTGAVGATTDGGSAAGAGLGRDAGARRASRGSALARQRGRPRRDRRPADAQQQRLDARVCGPDPDHISRRWMEGFYPIYATAQRTFGVNWLLIASIHRQEAAFSTAPRPIRA